MQMVIANRGSKDAKDWRKKWTMGGSEGEDVR
jgi:hypothetical protein